MDEKPVLFTLHAETATRHGQLQREWIERIARAPEWVQQDSDDAERRFGAVPERDGRILQVVCWYRGYPYSNRVPRQRRAEAGLKTPTIEYDPQVDAAYIRFSSNAVFETAELSSGIILDYDKDGKIVGMEVLDARSHLPKELVEAA